VNEWWRAADTELLHALSVAQQKLNVEYRAMLEIVQEVGARKLGSAQGYVTDIELLRCTQNISRSDARRRLSAASDVLPGRTPSGEPLPAALPATAAAVAEAAITDDHIVIIQRILGGLAPHLERHRDELEAYLAEQARVFDPPALRELGKRRIAFLDEDGARPRDSAPTRNRLSFAEEGGGWDVRGWLDRESAATLRTALSPLCAPRPADDGGPDPRTLAERQADGLIDLAHRALDGGRLPGEGGERPHVTVTVPLTVLESRIGNGLLGFAAGSVAAEDARRWACDAHLVPVVIGGRGEPLDVGRASYTVPRWMRRALVQRDGGCAFPGCTVPAQWAAAHHVTHWALGGVTALHNLVLLCPRHHTVVHHTDWDVTITGGFPVFHPPPWIPGGARGNAVHRIDLPLRR
jgi:hypothetical protein